MRRGWKVRIVASCGAVLSVLLTGCGLVGGEDAASTEVLSIGTAVATSTTTTSTPADAQPADTGEFYRRLQENLEGDATPTSTPGPAPGADTPSTTAAPSDPYCYAMEKFVFETTQMFLAEDVSATMQRHGAAISEIDSVIAGAPDSVAGPARQVRQLLLDAVAPPAATASKDSLSAALRTTVGGNAEVVDGLLTATVAECDVTLSEPLRSTAEGLRLLAEG